MNRETSQQDLNTIIDTLISEKQNSLTELNRKVIIIEIPHTQKMQNKD